MPRKGHRQEKIVYALKPAEAGFKVAEICREEGIGDDAGPLWLPTDHGAFKARRLAGGQETGVPAVSRAGVAGPHQTSQKAGQSEAGQGGTRAAKERTLVDGLCDGSVGRRPCLSRADDR